jgi:hypothetical protein
LISPHDARVVYHAANVLFRTNDGGKTWQAISPDLTRDDKSKQKWSGGPITGDNVTTEYYCTIFAIAESPRQKGVLWAGSDDGLVHVSRDGGKTWDNVTKNLPGLPEWGTVCCIEASPHDAGTAYLVVDAHRLDDMRPYLYKTSDFGKSWQRLSDKLPQDVYLHVVREDPKSKGLLFAGTERGVVFSPDDGVTWQPLKLNLPTVAVSDLVIKDNDLVVGTNGRSIWILDDLTPLREMRSFPTPKEAEVLDVRLISTVQPAVRWRYHSPVYSTDDRNPGKNPPAGALIHYYLKDRAKSVTLEILDRNGGVVRKLTSEKTEPDVPEEHPDAPEDKAPEPLPLEAGLHRVVWDLREEGAVVIKGAKTDWGNPRKGPLALPGIYTVKLTVDGKTLPAVKLTVLPDPRVKLPPQELAEQHRLVRQLRDDLSRVTTMVDRLRSVKKQLTARNELLAKNDRAEPLVRDSKALAGKLDALEEKLHNPKAEVVYDILAQKGGAKLYSQLAALFEYLKESDGAPTQGIREVYEEQARVQKQLEAEYAVLIDGELAELNARAGKLGLPGVIVPVGQ